MEKDERKFVRYSSGNDRDYTIFDALLESLNKKEKKNKNHSPKVKVIKEISVEKSEKTIFDIALNKEQKSFFAFLKSPLNLVALALMSLGSIMLVWVLAIVYSDMVFYGKDLVTILFDSRLSESINLGIDTKLIYYLLAAITTILSSLTLQVYRLKSHHN